MSGLAGAHAWRDSPSAAVLGVVADGRAPAALWRRTLPEDVRREAATLADVPAFRHRSTVDSLSPFGAVDAVLEALGGSARWPAMARDLRQLLALVGALDGLAPKTLRIECIDDDGCRLFHADRVGVRLLCTYAGAGTELRPEPAAESGTILRMPTGGVLLMRGDLSAHGPGVLHRSPPNPERTPRLLAAVDA